MMTSPKIMPGFSESSKNLILIPFLNQALSLSASSSASSTYVQYASSPPPSRRDIIIDLKMKLYLNKVAGVKKRKRKYPYFSVIRLALKSGRTNTSIFSLYTTYCGGKKNNHHILIFFLIF
jgi:hypothetical protein